MGAPFPSPAASCPVWNRSVPFGTPDSQHSIPTTLAHPTRPGTAPDPHRTLTISSPWITMLSTVTIRRGYGVATGTAWTVLLAAADTSSEGPKCLSAHVLRGLAVWCRVGGTGGWRAAFKW